MKLRLKLPLAFVSAVLIALAAGLAGIFSLHGSLLDSGRAVQDSFARERAVGYVAVAFKAEVLHWKNALLRAADPAAREAQWREHQGAASEVDAKVRALLPTLDGEARGKMERFLTLHDQLRKHYAEAHALIATAGVTEADASVRGIDAEPAQLLVDSIGLLMASSADITSAAVDGGSRTVKIITVLMLTVAAGAIAAGLTLSRSIIRPLTEAVAVAQAISQGDLSAEIQPRSRCELGDLMRALGDMNASLSRIVGDVRGGTDTIATASSQIEAGNADLSSRTEQQAGALEETAASMEQLTATVRQNADNARQARQLAIGASDVAQRGGAVVSQVVETMAAIQESGRRIGAIIGVIDGIAFQTNILALNAAVEAARAGDQGRGFAVVATEVRSLAQRSHDAAKQIKQLIEASSARVEQGGLLVVQAGSTMGEVVDSVRRVSDIVGEISHASQEQRAGIEQVNQAVAEMDRVTQQNAALVEQAAAAASAMRDEASVLARTVGIFRLAPATLSGYQS
ncbi:HAMP domain-containing protein [Duganella sp. SAP-35]|uniref:HAMP domain-containing protein n=1 Tax=Duganella aceris TaxID=2703883 RepID=A0ABX0FML9_9BURK|nr:HAMP domain-containing protein [Duganella aceris]